MNIIGLGDCGCNVAAKFKQYPQYRTFLFNSHKSHDDNLSLVIPKQTSHEEYEKVFSWDPPDDLHGETTFICSSSGTITGCVLKLLEHFKNTRIRVVLILSEDREATEQYAMQHKLIFNALQDYARSGMFRDIVLISNEELESSIMDLTFLNRFDRMNDVISYSLHMLNVFENTKPVAQIKYSGKEHCRILSLGTYDYKENKEKMYFSLDNVKESVYYVSIPEKKLLTDTELVKVMKSNFKDKDNAAYRIYPNQHEQHYGFVVKKTFFIQGQNFS